MHYVRIGYLLDINYLPIVIKKVPSISNCQVWDLKPDKVILLDIMPHCTCLSISVKSVTLKVIIGIKFLLYVIGKFIILIPFSLLLRLYPHCSSAYSGEFMVIAIIR